jgi:hypothetical protein
VASYLRRTQYNRSRRCRFMQTTTPVQFMSLEEVAQDSDILNSICYKNNGFKEYKGSMLEHADILKSKTSTGKITTNTMHK